MLAHRLLATAGLEDYARSPNQSPHASRREGQSHRPLPGSLTLHTWGGEPRSGLQLQRWRARDAPFAVEKIRLGRERVALFPAHGAGAAGRVGVVLGAWWE
jgi:hypothetical protein